MKRKKLHLLYILTLFILSLGFHNKVYSQSKIYFHSGEVKLGEVVAEDEENLIVKIINDTTIETLVLNRAQIWKIKPESGRIIYVNSKAYKLVASGLFESNDHVPYKNEVSLNIINLFQNHFEVGYERQIKGRVGIEGSFGIIGLSWSRRGQVREYNNTELRILPNGGGQAEFGYRFYRSGEKGFLFRIGPKISFNKSSLQGIYIKPEFFFYQFSAYGNNFLRRDEDIDGPKADIEWEYSGGATGAMIKLGYQKILFNRITIDGNIGIGRDRNFGGSTIEGEYDKDFYSPPYNEQYLRYQNFKYTHERISWNNPNLAFSYELSVGFLF